MKTRKSWKWGEPIPGWLIKSLLMTALLIHAIVWSLNSVIDIRNNGWCEEICDGKFNEWRGSDIVCFTGESNISVYTRMSPIIGKRLICEREAGE